MAAIDDLLEQVGDSSLRAQLKGAVADLRQRKKFGLVYEDHVPETVLLPEAGLYVGATVMLRKEPRNQSRYIISGLDDQAVTLRLVDGPDSAITTKVAASDVLVVKPFGEPVFPVLVPKGAIARGGSKPHHAVINGENFHALQLSLYMYERQVDCIYIDPPYNTGARDWKYSNNYVDSADAWRHSKWLSFMEKRLRLAKRLLKSDGVLIVTIDEHEVVRLGMLLEDIFRAPQYTQTLITDVINPKGTAAANFSRVGEYLYVVTPTGRETIAAVPFAFGMPGDVAKRDHRVVESEDGLVRKLALRRDGAESSNRADRPRQFYALLLDPQTNEVKGIGPELALTDTYSSEPVNGLIPAYPLDGRGRERVWRYGRDTMTQRIADGEIRVTGLSRDGRFSLYHFKPVDAAEAESRRPRTVWWSSTHDAGAHGSSLLNDMLGKRAAFTFPKSLYGVADAINLVVRDRKDALIMDFFAGSGTTLHATALLNAQDGGDRRCVLVTNNEVAESEARRLNSADFYRGDDEYEAHGIYQAVTRPRVEIAFSGQRSDGSAWAGEYLTGGLKSAGFEQNVTFFDLAYCDPDEIDLGYSFSAICPVLWAAAGGIGPLENITLESGWLLPQDSPFAVLVDEDQIKGFISALSKRPDVSHVWLVTDSEPAFARLREKISGDRSVGMLYRDYLRNFEINVEGAL